MINDAKLNFMITTIQNAYKKFGVLDKNSLVDKAAYDLVTSTDFNIEAYIIDQIKQAYPTDRILSEETNSSTVVEGCTWTIDPIDGTYNMANGLKIYGIQCAVYVDGKLDLAAMYLPHLDELYCAKAGCGAYLNGEKIQSKAAPLDHCIVSFGDFPHSRPVDTERELRLISSLVPQIARIRMFGAACADFAFVAAGKTHGTVLFTKNKWDIAPGILICQEAGAFVRGVNGEYDEHSEVVVAAASEELCNAIANGLK